MTVWGIRRPRSRGFTLLEATVTLGVAALLLAGAVSLLSQPGEANREDETIRKLTALANAITGDPRIVTKESRTDFGFIGAMGSLPASLEELWILGAQTVFSFDTSLRMGSGWAGPYFIVPSVDEFSDIALDGWGNSIQYEVQTAVSSSTGQTYRARLISYGPDADVGDGDDLTVEIYETDMVATARVGNLDRPERGEFRDQFQRVEEDVGGSIRPGALEAVGEPGVEPLRETFDGQGRPGGLAADPFQSRAVVGGDGDVGVEAEAGYGGAPGSGQELARLLIDPDSGDRDPSSLVGTGGDAARDGGTVEGRQPRLKVGEGIDLVGIGIGTQAAALEQGRDPTRHASGKPGDLGVIGWRQRMEAGMPDRVYRVVIDGPRDPSLAF